MIPYVFGVALLQRGSLVGVVVLEEEGGTKDVDVVGASQGSSMRILN